MSRVADITCLYTGPFAREAHLQVDSRMKLLAVGLEIRYAAAADTGGLSTQEICELIDLSIEQAEHSDRRLFIKNEKTTEESLALLDAIERLLTFTRQTVVSGQALVDPDSAVESLLSETNE